MKSHGAYKNSALCGACNIPKIRIPQEGGHGVFATTKLFNFGHRNFVGKENWWARKLLDCGNNTMLQGECINTGLLEWWNSGMVDWIVFFFVFHYLMHAHIQ